MLLEATEKTQKPFLDRALQINLDSNQDVYNYIANICKEVIDKKDKNIKDGVLVDLFQRILNLNLIEESKRGELEEIKDEISQKLTLHGTSGEFYWGTTDRENFNNITPIYETHLEDRLYNLEYEIMDEFSKIKIKIVLRYFFELVKGYTSQEHIGPLIGRIWKKFNMLEKLIDLQNHEEEQGNLTVISLRDVNIEMKKTIPLILCKQAYDNKKSDNETDSLHIIIDEAHNILSEVSQRESEIWKDYRLETFEEIIKEGRKFGVFLTIASQRPSDISHTIISQLHNYFIHKLINENDIRAVERAVAYLDKLSFQTIPILSVGSCFLAGIASNFAIKIDIDLLPEHQQPKSATVNLSELWG